MSGAMKLSDMLASRQRQGHEVVFSVSADWTQGRTVFGGLLSALGVQAMRDVVGADWPLRALQVNFIAPVQPGAARYAVTLLRQGKNVRQVQCVLSGAEGVAATLVGVFGADRASELPVRLPVQPPAQTPFDQTERLPFFEGLSPNFTRQIDCRWAEGGIPFTQTDTWGSKVYLLLQDGGIDRELLTVMLTDTPPTPTLSRFDRPVVASSVSWALELRVPRPFDIQPAGTCWRIDIDTKGCGAGYTNEVATLWTPEGEAAAFGYQVVAVFG